ncbi:hypothetical protein, partial [Hyphomonas sp.]|uniref:hypothetical protein n=1 Tax=Hyphomonas sp. TaxID=87 RepID=UPI003297C09F
MDITIASRFENLVAYTAATTVKEDGVAVPVLARLTIPRGERAFADQLTVNQVLLTCAGAVEAGSAEDSPNLA